VFVEKYTVAVVALMGHAMSELNVDVISYSTNYLIIMARMLLTLSAGLKEKIHTVAEEHDLLPTELVRDVLRDYIKSEPSSGNLEDEIKEGDEIGGGSQ
jgi:hypothetical protein